MFLTSPDRWVVSVGTGSSQLAQIRLASRAGYRVAGIDRSGADEFVDLAVPLSTYQSTFAADWAQNFVKRGNSVAGVITRTSGPPVATARLIAKKIEVPAYSDDVVQSSISKGALHAVSSRLGIPAVCPVVFTNSGSLPYPVVVKPAQPVVGKQNVYFVEYLEQLSRALNAARTESLDGRAVVQEFLPGRDIGVFLLCVRGHTRWSFVFEEHVSTLGGRFVGVAVSWPVENVHASVLTDAIQYSSTFAANGRHTGFVCFSFRLTAEGDLLLYEVNPGLGGDQIADELMPRVFPGFDPSTVEFSAMLGLSLPQDFLDELNEDSGVPSAVCNESGDAQLEAQTRDSESLEGKNL